MASDASGRSCAGWVRRVGPQLRTVGGEVEVNAVGTRRLMLEAIQASQLQIPHA